MQIASFNIWTRITESIIVTLQAPFSLLKTFFLFLNEDNKKNGQAITICLKISII